MQSDAGEFAASPVTLSLDSDPPMRILMVAPQPFFRPRGTPFSVLHRIRALLQLGHTVDLVTYPFGTTPDLDGLTIHRAARPPGVRDVRIGPSTAKVLLDAPLFLHAYRLARRGGFDLLHTHEEAGIFGAWLSRVAGLPHLYDMHSSLPQQFENFGRFNWPPVVAAFRALERYTLRGSDGVIVVYPALKEYLKDLAHEGPSAMIENTLDYPPPEFSDADVEALRRRLGLADVPTVLYTGTLEPYQGLDLLIDAAAPVRERIPEARFLVVGGTPEQSAELARRAREVAGDAVIFVPAVQPADVYLYHRVASALISPRTRGTNTPLKIYQYLRADLPIVATDIRSHTQVLGSDTAELVPADAASLAAGITRVLTDSEHATRLAAAAGRLAEERYSETAYVDRLRSLLERMPAVPGPAPAHLVDA